MNFKNVDFEERSIFQGLAIAAAGFFLLLYALGIIETGINILFILAATALIAYGVNRSGLYDVVRSYSQKLHKKQVSAKKEHHESAAHHEGTQHKNNHRK